ncbi:glutathione S-transferase family protein [Pararhodobacter sp.]|uniref:glutathione S-transferase family protein n=1 Tax=Pararhodobacter sp. TaxID=2127056 RepID=UPI002AFED8A3|nr:glutathione S-transferase family protein [Pararhodobacter sp.]
MVTLYGSLRSRTLRPLWLLREMDAPFEWVPVVQAYRIGDPSAASAPVNTASAAFRALNPMAQVPAMTDGELTLTESMAITLYLARKFGGPLTPQTEVEEALTLQWAFFGDSTIEQPALDILIVNHRGTVDTEQGRATIDAARKALQQPFARLDAHLQSRPWLLGDRFTVADILLVECVRFAMYDTVAFAEFAALRRWLEACRARPVFTQLWAERTAEPDRYA